MLTFQIDRSESVAQARNYQAEPALEAEHQ